MTNREKIKSIVKTLDTRSHVKRYVGFATLTIAGLMIYAGGCDGGKSDRIKTDLNLCEKCNDPALDEEYVES